MKIISSTTGSTHLVIREATRVLKNGGVIVYPTETAYGLGADFFNAKARRKIYRLKGRSFNKPLSVIVSSKNSAAKTAKFSKNASILAKKHWPGPLTLVLPAKGSARKIQKTLALRVTSQALALAIAKSFKKPLTATSANISGSGECYSITDFLKQVKGKKIMPDLIIDAGHLPQRKVSTIVDVTGNQTKILRQGLIKIPKTRHQITNNNQ